MNLRNIFLVGAVILFAACNSVIKVRTPLHRGERPETRGKPWKLYGSAGYGRAQEAIILNDASSRPPDFSQANNETSGYNEFWGRAALTPLEWLDVGVKYSAASVPIIFAKTQFLGGHEPDSHTGNFSLTSTVGYGGATFRDRGESYIASGSTSGYNGWSSDLYMRSVDVALISGYRLSDQFQFFGGFFYTTYKYTGNLKQDAHASGLPEMNYSLSGEGRTRGANVAIEWTQYKDDRRTFGLGVEGVGATFEFDRTKTSFETGINVWIIVL